LSSSVLLSASETSAVWIKTLFVVSVWDVYVV
jgi:hypothetical protein